MRGNVLIHSKWRWFWLSYPLQFLAMCFVLIPFVRFNNLLEWDFSGHYAAVWHVKFHLLPWFSGWNPFFYGGFPENVFYPPLAHFLAAILSYPLGVAGAMKLLVCLSLLVLPVAFYSFGRRWGLDDLQAAVCATWMTAQMFLCGELFGSQNLGSDLKALLNVGLFANALSLPLLFFFMAGCGGGDLRKHWKGPALLLGVLILVHPLAALIAGIFWASLCMDQFLVSPQDRSWRTLIRILAIGFLLSALWAVPFIARRGYMNPETIPINWSLPLLFLVINGSFLALSHVRSQRLRPLAVTFTLLANFILIGSMWKIDIQFPRLTIYLLFLLPIFLVAWLRSRFLLLSAGAMAIAVGAYGYFNGGIQPKGVPDFAMPDFGKVEGRILSAAHPAHLPSYHVHHDLIPVRTGNQAILGLFIESGINGRFMADLTRMIDPHAYVWGTPSDFVGPGVLKERYLQYVMDRLRLFGISHVYTDTKLEVTLDPGLATKKRYINSYPAPKFNKPEEREYVNKRYHLRGDQIDFYLYEVGTGELAEALPYVPKSPQSHWKMTNTLWFMQMQGVPIFTEKPAPQAARGALPGERVEVLSKSRNGDRLELQVHAEQEIPVFVRMGYFPNWRLTIDGHDAEIYRASPDLMLFYGKGRAVLEFERSWIEYAGLLLSCLGLLALVRLK